MQRIFQNRKIMIASIITVVVLALFGSFIIFRNQGQETKAADWFNENWYYRQSSSLTNSSSTDVTNQYVKVTVDTATLITAGKMQSDCDDLRVTNAAGNLLPFFIDGDTEYDCNDSDTAVWVMVDSIPTSGSTIYLYYGNPSAENGEATIGTREHPAPSCRAIYEHGDSRGDGQYYITPSGNKADEIEVTCDMSYDGGGWVMVFHGLPSEAMVLDTTHESVKLSNDIVFNDIRMEGVNLNFNVQTTVTETAKLSKTIPQYYYEVDQASDASSPRVNFHDLDGNQDVLLTSNYFMYGYGNSWRVFYTCVNVSSIDYLYLGGYSPTCTPRSSFVTTDVGCNGSGNNYCSNARSMTPKDSGLGLSLYEYQETKVWVRENDITLSQTNQSASLPSSEEKGPGPVAYWSFDEGYGSTAYDQSPNDNHGTITGATWKPDSECKFGKCLHFDGSGDYIAVSSKDVITGSFEQLTLSAWIKPTTISSVNDIVVKGQSGVVWDYGMLVRDGKLNYRMSACDKGTSEVVIESNKWQYVAIVVDDTSNEIKFFINGNEYTGATNDQSGTCGTSLINSSVKDLVIGNALSRTEYFDGFIDEVKIYNYARTADQIKQDYNQGKSVYFGSSADQSLSDGLVGWWKFDESAPSTCATANYDSCDSSGNGNDGDWNGGAFATSSSKFGQAIEFDGSDADYVAVPDGTLDFRDEITVAAWVKLNSPDSQEVVVYSNGFIDFRVSSSDFRVYLNVNNSWSSPRYGPIVSNGFTPQAGTWYHLVTTYDKNNNWRLYIDGELNTEMNFGDGIYDYTGSWKFGYAYSGTGLNGVMDDTRIYNRALSPEEVRRLYEWAPGPIYYADFNENDGTSTLYDKSGFNHSGTMYNFTEDSWVVGKYGSALDFNWNNDYVRISDPADGSLDLGRKDFTLMAWIKLRSVPTDSIIFSKGTSGSVGYGISIDPSSRQIQADIQADTGSNEHQLLGSGVPLNQWTHVAVVFDRDDKMYGYQNGVLVGTGTYNTGNDGSVDSADALEIGRLSGTYQFDGLIDEVKIFDYALTPRQVLEQMNAGRKNNPIAYWSFDEGQGTTAHDQGLTKQITGTGYDGTLTNMSTSGTSTSWKKYGKKGGALKFDGVDDYVDISGTGSDFLYGENDVWSVGAWFRTEKDWDGYGVGGKILSKGTSSAKAGYAISVGNQSNTNCSNKFGFVVDASPGNNYTKCVANSPDINDGKWHYGLVIFDAKDSTTKVRGRIYLDGEDYGWVDSTVDKAGWLSDSNYSVQLGKAGAGGGYYQGDIDEVKIYNYPLTLDEIRQNYNQGKQIVLSKSKEEVRQATEGLIGWWKMDEDSWNGTTGEVIDYSGAGHHGTATNAVSTSTAKYGRAGYFDGAGDYIDMGDIADLGEGDFTIQSWIKTGTTANKAIVAKTNGGGYEDGYGYLFRINGGALYFNSGSTASNYFTLTSVDRYHDNAWHQVAVVVDRSSNDLSNIYVDGNVVAATKSGDVTTLGDISNALNFRIGDESDGGFSFDGFIDDVRIYNYARSPEQIMRDYIEGPPPIAYWKMDEKSGTITTDSSGQGNDGTIASATWLSAADCQRGACLQFDGSNDYVNIPSITLKKENASIGFWFKVDKDHQFAAEYMQIIGLNGGFQFIGMYNNDLRAESNTNQDFWATAGTAGTDITKGIWYHWLLSASGGVVKSYINGVLNTTSTPVDNLTIPYIGRYFDGVVDEVKVWDYGLTPRQVAYEYNQGAPIVYYKFDKGEGGTAYDYSGNGNHGTIYPGTAGTNTSTSTMWLNGATGKINGSLDFDGTDDWVRVPDPGLPTDDFTYSVWVNLDTTNNETILESVEGTAAGSEFKMSIGSGKVKIITNGYIRLTSNKVLSAGTWYHLLTTREDGNIKLYINGELDPNTGTNSSILDFTSCPFLIGVDVDSGCDGSLGDFADGQIDEVKIWNYALTPEEVKREYNAGFGIFLK